MISPSSPIYFDRCDFAMPGSSRNASSLWGLWTKSQWGTWGWFAGAALAFNWWKSGELRVKKTYIYNGNIVKVDKIEMSAKHVGDATINHLGQRIHIFCRGGLKDTCHSRKGCWKSPGSCIVLHSLIIFIDYETLRNWNAHPTSNYIWLVVSNINFIFHFICGIIPTPLTKSYFSRWAHCTTNQISS